jgi:IS5 family transposase
VEEALYDSATLRQFVGIDLGAEPVPDETTVCKFRHLLEEHNLGEEILGTVNLHLQAKGVGRHPAVHRFCSDFAFSPFNSLTSWAGMGISRSL